MANLIEGGYMSTIKKYEWKDISEVVKETPPMNAEQAIDDLFPGSWGAWCRWQWSITLTGHIDNCVVVLHGPLGCNTSGRVFHGLHFEEHFGLPFLNIACTDMSNNQVVLGGEDELEETIKQVDRDYNPPLIVVHSNCCAGLNMDDISGIVKRVQDNVKAKVIYIPTEGFSCTWPGDMMERNMPLYVEQIMEKPDKIDKRGVNIVGLYKDLFCGSGMPSNKIWKRNYPSNADELGRTIEALGLRVHRALLGGDYEYIRTAPEAAVNVIDCPGWGYPLAEKMKELFGTPYLPHGKPIGVECTIRWINDLANFMGVKNEADRFINREYSEIKEIWEKAKSLAKGKVALINGVRSVLVSVTRPLAQARFAQELGMTPYLFNLIPVAAKSKEYVVEYFVKDGTNPKLLAGPYPYQKPVNIFDVIKDLGISSEDVVYFHQDVFREGILDPSMTAVVDNVGQPFRRAKDCPRDVGFRGTLGMARDVITAIQAAKRRNRVFVRPTLYGRLSGKNFDFEKGETL